jgi:glutamate-5-semialdehyde dehydrogenase
MAENQKDMERMPDGDPKKDRLFLNEKRIQGLADSLRDVALLPDPSGQVLLEREIETGLKIERK